MKFLFLTFALSTSVLASEVQTFCERYEQRMMLVNEAQRNGGYIKSEEEVIDSPEANRNRYYGCGILKNDWRQELYKQLCATVPPVNPTEASISLPKTQVVFFDGFGEFAINEGRKFGAVNLEGYKGADSIRSSLGRANGIGYLVGPMLKNLQKEYFDQMEFHYYAGSGLTPFYGKKMAIACQKELIADFDSLKKIIPKVEIPKLIVLGYSNGGVEALKFAHAMNRDNVEIELLLTVDPIPQGLGYVTDMASQRSNTPERPINVLRHVNLYQQSDVLSMKISSIKGKPVLGADENILVSPGPFTDKRFHIFILKDFFVHNKVFCELHNANLSLSSSNCYSSQY